MVIIVSQLLQLLQATENMRYVTRFDTISASQKA